MRAQADILFAIILFTVVALGFIVAVYLNGQLTSALQPVINPTNNSNSVVAQIQTSATSGLNVFGNMLAIVFFAIGIAAIIAAFFVDANPVFFILSMFILAAEILVSAILHNVFFTIAQQSFLLGVTQQFPYLITIFQYYPEFTFIMALGVMVALYAK
jgi:hypothetical protein